MNCIQSHRLRWWSLAWVFLLPAWTQAEVSLSSNKSVSNDGYYQLTWESTPVADDDMDYILQQAASDQFADAKTVYQGPDRARVVSGMPDGQYFYRVRSIQGEWSEPVKIEVAHHSIYRAFFFLALGAIVFIATVVVIINGNRAAQR